MINHKVARAKLAEIAAAAVGDEASVTPGAIDAVAAFPLVTVGLPRWTPQVQPCIDRSQFPVAVVVKTPGGDAAATQDQLDELWQTVAAELDAAISADQSLGGVCVVAHLERAEPGPFRIQGQEYPAQIILINLDG